jgi:hypothetical protein
VVRLGEVDGERHSSAPRRTRAGALMAFVKMISEDPGRPSGRVRVRILDESTNKLVAYPSGRVRWFGSEEAADEWICAQRRLPPRTFRPRNYSGEP